MAALLQLRDLTVSFMTSTGLLPVLSDVGISIEPGQSLGVVGESGSGKTVLVRTILGLLEPQFVIERGSVRFREVELIGKTEKQLAQIRGKDIALTTPEPRKHLNPLLTVGDQISRVVRAHAAVSRRDAMERAAALLRTVGIPDPERRLASYPHEMSGGMCQRVIIAMALAHSSSLLLVDEPTAGLDVTISRQILDQIAALVRDQGASLLLVSRDLGVVAHYCERVAVMYAGRIVEEADVPGFFARPVHPYSRHLLRAAVAARDRSRHAAAAGLAPAAIGCAYAPRCPLVLPECQRQVPPYQSLEGDRHARCLRSTELIAGEVAA